MFQSNKVIKLQRFKGRLCHSEMSFFKRLRNLNSSIITIKKYQTELVEI